VGDSSPAPGQELYFQVLIIAERNTAKELGNSERLQKWQEMKPFPTARKEWTRACKIFAKRYGLDPFLRIRSDKQNKRQDVEGLVLTLLKVTSSPAAVLKKQAAVIYSAACEGDVRFFRKIGRALRGQKRVKGDRSFLAWNILRYWFAGLLWLMNDEAGVSAFRAYTGTGITKDAYRKAYQRLRLKGYKGRTKSPPVLRYQQEGKTYDYSPSWTWIEPHLSK
jgi:hypothetical protein